MKYKIKERNGNIYIRKLFFIWDEQKEKLFLEEAAQKHGLILQKVGFGIYYFNKENPKKIRYEFDFLGFDKNKNEYLTLTKDNGWKHICDFGGWMYFSTKNSEEETPPLYTDNPSKIKRLFGLLTFLFIVTFPSFYLVLISNIMNKSKNNFLSNFYLGAKIIYFFFLVLLIFAMYKIIRMIIKLKEKK